jgi:hypothetical protein
MFTDDEVEAEASRIADVFLRAYGTTACVDRDGL